MLFTFLDPQTPCKILLKGTEWFRISILVDLLINWFILCLDHKCGNEAGRRLLYKIRDHVPSASMNTCSDTETVYTLPVPITGRGVFVTLFHMFDELKEELGIKTYDVRDCGLEQVFVKVTTGR